MGRKAMIAYGLLALSAGAWWIWAHNCTPMPETWSSETLPHRIVIRERAYSIRLPAEFSGSGNGYFSGPDVGLEWLDEDIPTRYTLKRQARYCAKGNVIDLSKVEWWDDVPDTKGVEWVVEVHDAEAGTVRFLLRWYRPGKEMIYKRALYALSIPFTGEGIVR